VVFEITKSAKMKVQEDCHYLTFTHAPFAISRALLCSFERGYFKVFTQFSLKILAELVCSTEDFNNFVYGNHRFFDCNCLVYRYKVAKNKRDYRFL
ncbi:MAG: hypothetical protein SOZ18_05680, partial [Phocaeicola sp.]|nr:hypothetical protein [Phocaeicola sp.]